MLVMDKAKTEPSKRRAFLGVESHDDFELLQSNKTKKSSITREPRIGHWAKESTDLL